ncbi:MAG: peptidase T [Lachnospiraceae bacterium]|nr:peptidase T [Lachnospiraceae bacterium]
MSSVTDRFLRYVQIDTRSDDRTGTSPSTAKQHYLANVLVGELKALGITDITYDTEHCYVYASIPASVGCEKALALGFIAHMDTSPAVTGENVKPKCVENYDGRNVLLNEEKNIWLSVEEFPELLELVGQDLIVTDGTTLLGADDKAGVAEIMAMAEYLISHPEVMHGKICIGFTPDEEIGCGTDFFDIAKFGAKYAYTVDGGALGELEYENFNAAGATVHFYGRNVHPGSAKGKMKNALLIAQEFQSLLPVQQNPMYTEGYEGFFHLDRLSGAVEEAEAEYIIRDHDRDLFEEKKNLFHNAVRFLKGKYGPDTIVATIKDSYYNMKDAMTNHMHLVDSACEAMKELGVEPKVMPIRGGTDGARLTYMGLPCPNLCTGGANFHSRFEYVSVDAMEKTVELLVALAKKYAMVEFVKKKRYTYEDFERKKDRVGGNSVGMFGEEIYAMKHYEPITVSNGYFEYYWITEEEFLLFPENSEELSRLIIRDRENRKKRLLCSDYNLAPYHKSCGFEV